jgi:integrase/recombinase XerD
VSVSNATRRAREATDRARAPLGTRLTLEQLIALAPLIRDAMKDKSYQLTPIGMQAAEYLRVKRKRLTGDSYRDYESGLDKLARYFPDLRVQDFEPPTGTQRLEEFLDHQWGDSAPRTYNKGLSIVRDFFRWQIPRGKLHGDPTLLIERAKSRQVYRTTFSTDQRRAILAAAVELRDRIALRLLLDYALRKGALRAVQIKHFDHQRRRLTVFTKGQKVRELPLPHAAFWTDLERYILESEARPDHYLMVQRTGRYGKADPTKPIGPHGLHSWWYRRLAAAGIVPEGTTKGERMHKARHTAGQRVLDAGNLKAVQKLLGHTSIQTTGDIYADWDVDQLAATMAEVLDDDSPTDNEPTTESFPLSSRKALQMRGLYRQRDSNPCYRRERAAS